MERTYDTASYASRYLPEKSIYQDDARVFHRGGCAYDNVAAIRAVTFAAPILTASLTLDSGLPATLQVIPVGEGIIRVKFWWGDTTQYAAASFDETSEMLLPRTKDTPPPIMVETETYYDLHFDTEYTLRLFKNPFGLHILRENRCTLELETEAIAGEYVTPPLGFRVQRDQPAPQAYISWRIHNNERFFGLGEKWNKVEKTSTRAVIWAADTCGSNTTDMSYKALPLLYSTLGWGILLHTGFRSNWEIGAFSYTSGSTLVEDVKLDLFLFLAPTLKELVELYSDLTGKPQMPPRWALGVWMSRCAYLTRAQVEAVLNRLREERIPCDVVHLDPHWMKTHYYFSIGVDACDFVWDTEDWPDHREMLRQWHTNGFDVCFWINPYLPESTEIYETAKAKDYLLKCSDGTVARLEHGQPVGTVDFSNPEARAWWQGYLKALIADGASVFKPDYGDRVSEDTVFFNGKTGKEMHNRFMFLYTEAAFEVAQQERGESIVWRRSGYVGSQRYPGTWAGDTQVTWQGMLGALRGGLSAGFGSEAFWSHDIGGFAGPQPDPELYIRWAQFGLFSPFSRFHGTSPREPWEYGPEALDNVRRYAQLRYALMPYWLACARESCATGLPLMRHMRLEFPDEPNVDTLDDQYALGSDLLIAPVLNPGMISRSIYFPQGRWWALENAKITVDGPGFRTVAAPLERIPIFVRAGAVLPRYNHQPQHLKEPAPDQMDLIIYPGPAKKTLAFDENGFVVRIEYSFTNGVGTLHIAPAPLTFNVVLVDFQAHDVRIAKEPSTMWETHGKDTVIVVNTHNGVEVIFR